MLAAESERPKLKRKEILSQYRGFTRAVDTERDAVPVTTGGLVGADKVVVTFLDGIYDA
jgi:hypothetical protein